MESNTAHSQGPSAESLRRGYETSDITFSGLVWFVLGTIVFAVVLWIIIWFIMQMFLHNARVDDVPRSAIHAVQVPPAPTIQPMHAADVLPSQDLQEMREHDAHNTAAILDWRRSAIKAWAAAARTDPTL